MKGFVERIAAALSTNPILLFIAGPNGAGKTTFYRTFLLPPLGNALPFVNADEIGRTLRETQSTSGEPGIDLDRRAFQQTEALRESTLAQGLSFCTETVFSDPVGHKLDFLRRARASGYFTFLVFVGLTDVQLSKARVLQRVEEGGHDVSDDKLEARFPRTLANLRSAIAKVEEAYLFDNSDPSDPYRPVAVYVGGRLTRRWDPIPAWALDLPGMG